MEYYLPISLSSGILVGALVRVIVEKKFKKNEKQSKMQVEKGILLASGLVAGDAILGILVAVVAANKWTDTFDIGHKIMPTVADSNWIALIVFVVFGYWLYRTSAKVDEKA